MKFINRPVLVIKPRQPYLDWTQRVSSDSVQLKLEDLQQDCTTYLLSEALDRQQLESFLHENFGAMFKHELYAWHRDQSLWPAERSYAIFGACVDIHMHSPGSDMLDPESIPHDLDISS